MIANRVALVTGAARGIGASICNQLLEDGFYVIGVDIAPITREQSGFSHYQVDLTDKNQVINLVDKVGALQGRLDVLVNNAGITRDALLADMQEQQWDSVLDINLKAVFLLTQQVLPMMVKQQQGSIINIASIVATDGNIGQSNYAASKGGVIAMSKGWAKEFARKGAQIRVNCVAPGFIETEMTEMLPDKVVNMMEEKTPLGRMGKAEEIADGVAFLASDKSRFITGQTLKIDGGLVL